MRDLWDAGADRVELGTPAGANDAGRDRPDLRARPAAPPRGLTAGGAALHLAVPADVAQLVEHFTRNEGVRGSSPRVGFSEIPAFGTGTRRGMSSGGGAPAVSRALDRGAEAPRRKHRGAGRRTATTASPLRPLGGRSPHRLLPRHGRRRVVRPRLRRTRSWAHCSCFSRPARDPSAGIGRRCGSSACRRRPGSGGGRVCAWDSTHGRAHVSAVEHFAANDGREGIARIGVAAFDGAAALGRTASAAGSRGWSAVRVRAPRAWQGLAATARSLAREGRSASIRIWARMRPLLRRAWSACRAAFMRAAHELTPLARSARARLSTYIASRSGPHR